jgi:hypothetical protein
VRKDQNLPQQRIIGRPFCEVCKAQMWLACIEPDKPDYRLLLPNGQYLRSETVESVTRDEGDGTRARGARGKRGRRPGRGNFEVSIQLGVLVGLLVRRTITPALSNAKPRRPIGIF